ncbi:MAG: 30S ribosomal protein S6 [Acidobacteriota bacterium]
MYETVFIAEPGLPEPDADSLAEGFHKVVTEGSGSLKKTDSWGKKKLAYAVRKHEEGYYYHLRYEAPPEAVTELERRLRNHEQILKYLSVRLNREALQAVEIAEQKAAEKAAARAAREAERAARQAEAAAAAEAAGGGGEGADTGAKKDDGAAAKADSDTEKKTGE